MFKYIPNGKSMVYDPMDKELWLQWNIPSYFIAPVEKAWFYEIIVMAEDKKRCTIKDTMSIKTSFMHYRNYITWTKVKSAIAFEEFDMVYLFCLLFSLHCHCQSLSIFKRSTLAKIWGGGAPPSPPCPVSTGLVYFLFRKQIMIPCSQIHYKLSYSSWP